ncbi:hypothetical protein ACIBBB_30665 [Streptomyces sp. NPDC051217]
MAFTVSRGRIVSIDILNDPERLDRLDLTVLDGWAKGSVPAISLNK